MAPEKRNEFLDASDSEDDVPNYDSDDSLKKGGRVTKRRKVDESDEDDASDVERNNGDESEEKDGGERAPEKNPETETKKLGAIKGEGTGDLADLTSGFFKKNLVVTEAAIAKSGVVYISRVPPFMKPHKLRSLLERYGKINRIFLAPEDPTSHARRVRAGGNKKRLYTEGWVEFVKKKDAKAVCEVLNARIIGGKKGNYYHDDIWNLLYLKGFKWHHLMEQITSENAERASRMRAEISSSTKENKEFVRNIEKAKMLDGMEAKNKGKKRKPDQAEGETERKGFRQISLANKGRDKAEQPDGVSRVMSKIF